MSGNKNVADYTNFQGRTHKRIVQAPGGSSSLTLAWSNDPIDYGPWKQSHKPPRAPDAPKDSAYLRGQSYSVSTQPVGQLPPLPPLPNTNYGVSPQPYVPPQSSITPPYHPTTYQAAKGLQQLDIAVQQQIKQQPSDNQLKVMDQGNERMMKPQQTIDSLGYNMKPQVDQKMSGYLDSRLHQDQRGGYAERMGYRPSSQTKIDNRPCVRINGPPREQFSLGDGNYNYWELDFKGRKEGNSFREGSTQIKSEQSKRGEAILSNRSPSIFNQQPGYPGSYPASKGAEGIRKDPESDSTAVTGSDRPSIRVNNPPGGKGSFAFG